MLNIYHLLSRCIKSSGAGALVCAIALVLLCAGSGTVVAQSQPQANAPYFAPDDSYTDFPINELTRTQQNGHEVDYTTGTDDGTYGPITLPFTFNMYGVLYNQVWINNNGMISFMDPANFDDAGDDLTIWDPAGFPQPGLPMIAPLWCDVDTRVPASGKVKFKVEDHRFIVTWPKVGYFFLNTDLLNEFQVIISDTTDTIVGVGYNVAFNYGQLQWANGDGSLDIVDQYHGFGPDDPTAGVNSGDGTNYIQIGRFGLNSTAYDGGGGNRDGLHFLDHKSYRFNVARYGNQPPSVAGLPIDNTFTVPCGKDTTLNLSFNPPEIDQLVAVTNVDLGGLTNVDTATTSGAFANTTLTIHGSQSNMGTHVVTYTAKDNFNTWAASGVTTVQINIVVTAPSLPVASSSISGANLNLAVTSGGTGATYAWTGPNSFSSTQQNPTITNYTSAASGTYTVTVTSSGQCALTTTTSVSLGAAPTVTCPGNVSASASAGQCSAVVTYPAATVTGSPAPDVTYSTPSGSTFPVGTTSVTVTATNSLGSTSCNFNVVVSDNEKPTVSCLANQTKPTDNNSCGYTAVGTEFDPTSFADNCSGVTINNNYNNGSTLAGAVFPSGTTTTVIWTAIDAANNTQSCSFTVTVQDMQAPTITAPAAIAGIPADAGLSTASNVALGSPSGVGDNCLGVTVTNDAPTLFPVGTTTVTWTATDAAGNKTTATQLVTVFDNQPPQIFAPPIFPTVPTAPGQSGVPLANVDLGTPTFSDNNPPVVITNDAPPIFPIGTTIVTWTATDPSGNTATVTETVTVLDQENPTITAPPALPDVSTNPGSPTATGFGLGTPAAGDNSGSVAVTNDAPTAFPIGTTTVTWTATDPSGNTTTSTQTVTVNDHENPTITAPPALPDVSTNPGSPTASGFDLGNPAAGDNSGNVSVTNDAPPTFPIGTTTVTWTATDPSGNSTTSTQTVTVNDHENPTITAPPSLPNVSTDPGSSTASHVDLGTPTANDNSGSENVTNNAPTTFPIGTTTVTWTATDPSGNSTGSTQLVTVQDHENPTITAPPALTDVSTDPGSSTASHVDLGTPTGVGDNSGSETVTNNSPATFPIGTTTVTWTATDPSGNTTTSTQLVTVNDHENPTITAPPALTNVPTDPNAATASGVALGTPTGVSDNSGLETVTNDAPATFPIGTTTVTWTATDPSGNTATSTQLVTVTDQQKPSITAPPALTDVPTDPGAASTAAANVTLGTPTVTDNVPGTTVTNNAPATFPIGTTTVTWTATDAAGNTATATQLVTVNDHENPTITAPAALTDVSTDAGSSTASNVSLGTPTVSDNAPGTTVTNNAPATFPIGTTTVTWTVTDAAGNTATATQLVTVNDHQTPTITCVGPQTKSTDNNACTYTAVGTEFNPTAYSDNVAGATINNDFNNTATLAGAIFPKGVTTVKWTVTDVAGNSNNCSFTVTVNDNQKPTITAPAALTDVSTNVGACTATGVSLGTPVIGDNCPGVAAANNAPASFAKGTTTVTWTATDAAGNTQTATQSVTVKDHQKPTITAPAALTNVPMDPGSATAASANVSLGSPVIGDNCPGVSASNNAPANFPAGTTTVTWTATDAAGNTQTATQAVTVKDNQAPSITAPPAIVQVSTTFPVYISDATLGTPTITDNVPNPTYTRTGVPTGNKFPCGTTTITYTAKDAAGNTATATQTVKVAPGTTVYAYGALHVVGSGHNPVTKKYSEPFTFRVYCSKYTSTDARTYCNTWNSNVGRVEDNECKVSGPDIVQYGGGPACKYTITVPMKCTTGGSGDNDEGDDNDDNNDRDDDGGSWHNSDGSHHCYDNGSYTVIGRSDDGGTPVYVGCQTNDLNSGRSCDVYHQVIQDATGKRLPASTTCVPGSLLLIAQPEYLDFTGDHGDSEYLPIVYESVIGEWNTTAQPTPPDGFVADTSMLTAVVVDSVKDSSYKALQFVITDTGSTWTSTTITHNLIHNQRAWPVNTTTAMTRGDARFLGRAGFQTTGVNPIHLTIAPNPFNPTAQIMFTVPPEDGDKNIEVKIFDMRGRDVTTLIHESRSAGDYVVTFDATELSSGQYVAAVHTANHMQSKMMVLAK